MILAIIKSEVLVYTDDQDTLAATGERIMCGLRASDSPVLSSETLKATKLLTAGSRLSPSDKNGIRDNCVETTKKIQWVSLSNRTEAEYRHVLINVTSLNWITCAGYNNLIVPPLP